VPPILQTWATQLIYNRRSISQAYDKKFFLVVVIALRPQIPKHIKSDWSHYTDTSKIRNKYFKRKQKHRQKATRTGKKTFNK
jgi:hypothetical protein